MFFVDSVDVFYRFVDGFNTLGLLQEMQIHTDLFPTVFVEDKKPLRSSDLTSLFEVNLSDQDTYKRELETRTLCYWRDWIIDVKGIYKSFLF